MVARTAESFTTWDLDIPGNSLTISGIPSAIRVAKAQLVNRIEREHTPVVGTGDFGGVHLPGSAMAYVQTLSPTTRPDTVGLNKTLDAGRIWVDDDHIPHYFTAGGDWQAFAIPIGSTSGFISIIGKSEGQTITGGIDGGDSLTFRASFTDAGEDGTNDITPGSILFREADLIDFGGTQEEEIASENIKLGTDLVANDKKITGLGGAIEDGDALSKGNKVITKDEVSSTGFIPFSATGQWIGANLEVKADIGFEAEFILVGNTTDATVHIWTPGMSAKTKKLHSGDMTGDGNGAVTVSANILTFPNNITGGNQNGKTCFYGAFTFNNTVTPTVPTP